MDDVLLPLTFTCAACWQPNETTVDPTQGAVQRYVEDCQVCCRPMLLTVRVLDGEASAEVEPESD